MLFIVADVTLLSRTRAVYKLMNFLMENIQPPTPLDSLTPKKKKKSPLLLMCYSGARPPFPHKNTLWAAFRPTNLTDRALFSEYAWDAEENEITDCFCP